MKKFAMVGLMSATMMLSSFAPTFAATSDSIQKAPVQTASVTEKCDATNQIMIQQALKTIKPKKVASGQQDVQTYRFPDGSSLVVTTGFKTLPKASSTIKPMTTNQATAMVSTSGTNSFGGTVWTLTFEDDFDYDGSKVTWQDTPWFNFDKPWWSVWTLTNTATGNSIDSSGVGHASGTATLGYTVGSIYNVQTVTEHCTFTENGDGTYSPSWS